MSQITNKEKNELEFFSTAPLSGSAEIKSLLKITEESHQLVMGYSHADAKEYFLYALLNEIEKAGAILVYHRELFDEVTLKSSKTNDRSEYLLLQTINEDISVWLRKITEVLTILIGFTQTDNNETYRHYLLIDQLTQIEQQYEDLKRYYNVENQNKKYQIDELAVQIKAQEAKYGISSNWYFSRNKKDRPKFTTFESRLQKVLAIATDAQKIAIGLSYENYRSMSQDIHASISSLNRFIKTEDVKSSYVFLSTLCMHSLIVVKDLLKKKPRRGMIPQIVKLMKKNDFPKKLIRLVKFPKIKKGDFVIAFNDLAEVTEVKKSNFGYKSYRVKYLSTPPIPNIKEEEFPYYNVKLYQEKKIIRDGVIKNLQRDGIITVSDKKLSEAICRPLIEWWEQQGGREFYFGKKEQGVRKLQEWLNKRKIN